jgi:hypothetical protein
VPSFRWPGAAPEAHGAEPEAPERPGVALVHGDAISGAAEAHEPAGAVQIDEVDAVRTEHADEIREQRVRIESRLTDEAKVPV